MDYINSITAGCNRYGDLNHKASQYITHLIVAEDSVFLVDIPAIRLLGIEVVYVKSTIEKGKVYYVPDELIETITRKIPIYIYDLPSTTYNFESERLRISNPVCL